MNKAQSQRHDHNLHPILLCFIIAVYLVQVKGALNKHMSHDCSNEFIMYVEKGYGCCLFWTEPVVPSKTQMTVVECH